MKKIIYILVFLVAVLLFELFLRFSPFSRGVSPVVYDGQIGMWHRRDFSGMHAKSCVRTRYFFDAAGRVKSRRPVDPQKPDVIILGASHVEALMVRNENIVHNRLSEGFGGKYNFLNYGLAGTSPTQHLEILKHKVDLSRAATVVEFISLDHDLRAVDPDYPDVTSRPKVHLRFDSLEHYRVIPPAPYRLAERLRDVLGNFELYTYLNRTFYFLKNQRPGLLRLLALRSLEARPAYAVPPAVASVPAPGWLQLQGAVYQMDKFCRQRGIDYISVVTFGNAGNRRVFLDFAKKHGIVCVDLMAELAARGVDTDPASLGFDCDTHWNDATHRHIARVLVSSDLL